MMTQETVPHNHLVFVGARVFRFGESIGYAKWDYKDYNGAPSWYTSGHTRMDMHDLRSGVVTHGQREAKRRAKRILLQAL